MYSVFPLLSNLLRRSILWAAGLSTLRQLAFNNSPLNVLRWKRKLVLFEVIRVVLRNSESSSTYGGVGIFGASDVPVEDAWDVDTPFLVVTIVDRMRGCWEREWRSGLSYGYMLFSVNVFAVDMTIL
jgi:hypothetical protein